MVVTGSKHHSVIRYMHFALVQPVNHMHVRIVLTYASRATIMDYFGLKAPSV